MKKTKIFFSIFAVIIIYFVISLFSKVEAKYVLQEGIDINYNTSDYYFNIETDKTEITSFPATINVTVKNNDGTNFTDTDLKYTIGTNNDNYTVIANGGNTKTLKGGSNQEETFEVTIDKKVDDISDSLQLVFNIETPYSDYKIAEIEVNEYVFRTEANDPDIKGFNKDSTYYVTWTQDQTDTNLYNINDTKTINEVAPNDWYNYTEGINKWANIKTTGGGNDCYWVWIPRYAYKVPTKSSTAQTIEIKFLQGKTNIPVGETEEITNTTPTPNTWVVHPAFTNEGNGGFGELKGIWVAKFEASSNSPNVVENPTANQLEHDGGSDTDIDLKIRVRPNVINWRGITVGNIFKVCQNLTTSGNSIESSTNIDSHMMKNTEWGAVAYLSRSKYGKNEVVWNNPYYHTVTNQSSITGLCGKKEDSTQTTLNYTEGATDQLYKYNTKGGTNASTTGNVYGIYDMAGGSGDCVAGILSSRLSYNTYYDFTDIDKKYYDSYISYTNAKYGDAVYETSTNSNYSTSWEAGTSYFVRDTVPVFTRGGYAGHGAGAGIFGFFYHDGNAHTAFGFRPCVVNGQLN